MDNTVSIHLRLSAEDRDALKKVAAEETGRTLVKHTVSDLVRKAVREWLAGKKGSGR